MSDLTVNFQAISNRLRHNIINKFDLDDVQDIWDYTPNDMESQSTHNKDLYKDIIAYSSDYTGIIVSKEILTILDRFDEFLYVKPHISNRLELSGILKRPQKIDLLVVISNEIPANTIIIYDELTLDYVLLKVDNLPYIYLVNLIYYNKLDLKK